MKTRVVVPFVYKLTEINAMLLGLGDVDMILRQHLRKWIHLLK
jgi:hypothetical protein